MKKSLLCGLTAALVVMAVGGCSKREPQAEASVANARPADTGKAILTGRTWTVCGIVTAPGHPPAHQVPPTGEKFEVVETVNNSGVYALKMADPSKWEPGWGALTLSQQGTDAARIPHLDWTSTCKQGDKSQLQPFAPTTVTKRYRGATCLPDGTPRHVEATCSTGRLNYHEIVIYVHEPATGSNDIPHMMLQYCGRDELDSNNQLMCDDPTKVPAARMPHPGHIHIDP